jgi:DNA-cytosine methyltransferase
VEINPYCQAVLKKHFPNATIYGDITSLDFWQVPRVGILTGGFPCRDISTAGKQKGITGERSSLWKYYAKAIGILRPRFAVIENVPNLANLGLNEVLAGIAQVGYDAEWFTLSASQFGAPHKRERLFVIAYPNSERFEEQGQVWRREGVQPVAQRKTYAPNVSGDRTYETPDCKLVQSASQISDGIGRQDNGWDAEAFFVTDDWGERVQRFREETLQGERGFSRFKDVRSVEELFKRSDVPPPLIRRGSNGLSSRLDSYLQRERTQAIGNAVVPQVAQFIARRLKEIMH